MIGTATESAFAAERKVNISASSLPDCPRYSGSGGSGRVANAAGRLGNVGRSGLQPRSRAAASAAEVRYRIRREA